MTGQWREMFEPSRGARPAGAPPPSMVPEEPEGDALPLDTTVYRPWIVQRVRARPSMLLDLRSFDARSGMWMGTAVAYPHLIAVEYVGDRMISLDFGLRQYVVQGRGLDELVRLVQEASVLAIQEYSDKVWATLPSGPVVTAIRRAGMDDPPPR